MTHPFLQAVERRPGGSFGRAAGAHGSRGRCGALFFTGAYSARVGGPVPRGSVGCGPMLAPERVADSRRIAARWTSWPLPRPIIPNARMPQAPRITWLIVLGAKSRGDLFPKKPAAHRMKARTAFPNTIRRIAKATVANLVHERHGEAYSGPGRKRKPLQKGDATSGR